MGSSQSSKKLLTASVVLALALPFALQARTGQPRTSIAHSASIESHFIEMHLQMSPAEEFRRSIVTVAPLFASDTLDHPFSRAGIP